MEGKILYSKFWSKKRRALMTELSNFACKHAIPLQEYGECIKTRYDIVSLLKLSENGFEDIVNKQKTKEIEDYSYSNAVDWILERPSSRLISTMAVVYNDNKPIRLETNLNGVKYFMGYVKRKKESF